MTEWWKALVTIGTLVTVAIMVLSVLAPKEYKTVIIDEETMQVTPMPGFMTPFFRALGFPEDWLWFPAFIYYGIVPLTGVWLILYGFLDQLRIFRREIINGVLAFLIAFSTIPLGLFVSMVALMFGMLGVYATIVFVILAIIGIGFMGGTLIGGWQAGALEARLFSDEERIIIDTVGKLEDRIKEEEKKADEIAKNKNIELGAKQRLIEEKDRQIRDLKGQIGALKEKKKDVERRKKLSKKEPSYYA